MIQTESAPRGITPPLKWAGGKRWLVGRDPNLLPANFDRYLEPFFGGGALFFSLQPEAATLSDANGDLIETYKAIRAAPKQVESALHAHARRHGSEYYYYQRGKKPPGGVDLAAWFLYMNRACYNGLYRVNRRGEFNVPKGTKDSIILDTDNFEAVSKTLNGAQLIWGGF